MRAKCLFNNRGSGMLVAIVGAIVGGVILLTAVEFGKISRANAMHSIEIETRAKITARLASAFEDAGVVNYTLTNFETPANNDTLKRCILAGVPAGNTDCLNASLQFYIPSQNGGIRIIGNAANPLYTNVYGDDCQVGTNAQPSPSCTYALTSKCTFTCPGGQTSCALVKVMTCKMNTDVISQGLLSRFIYRTNTTMTFSTYAFRISNDLTTFNVIH